MIPPVLRTAGRVARPRAESPSRSASRRVGVGMFAVGLVVAACGCGKRGAPLPPLPRGPLAPRNVAARQIGARAVVAFDVSQARGPKPAQQPVRADLVRVTYPPGPEPPADPDAFRRRGEVVADVSMDPLPERARMLLEDERLADLPDGGVGWTLRYAVRVRDRRGRSSPLVVAEDITPLPSAPGPSSLDAEPTADGVRLTWTGPEAAGEFKYNVYRSGAGGMWTDAPLNPEPLAITEYLDNGVTTGERYRYEVRVSLAAGQPYREGAPSPTRELVAVDRFAPAPPRGIVGVQEGLAVRLFWDPNAERDLAGYRVYRAAVSGPWRLLWPEAIENPSCLDEGVRVGQRWRYRVTAVDRAEPANESGPSEIIEIELVEEPVAPGRSDP